MCYTSKPTPEAWFFYLVFFLLKSIHVNQNHSFWKWCEINTIELRPIQTFKTINDHEFNCWHGSLEIEIDKNKYFNCCFSNQYEFNAMECLYIYVCVHLIFSHSAFKCTPNVIRFLYIFFFSISCRKFNVFNWSVSICGFRPNIIMCENYFYINGSSSDLFFSVIASIVSQPGWMNEYSLIFNNRIDSLFSLNFSFSFSLSKIVSSKFGNQLKNHRKFDFVFSQLQKWYFFYEFQLFFHHILVDFDRQ